MLRLTQSKRYLSVATLLIGVLLIGSSPAAASNFGSQGSAGTGGTTNGVFLTNNNVFFVAKLALTNKYASGVDHAMNDFDLVTDFFASSATDSVCSDSAYDVCVFDANYGDNGLNGWNACAGTTTGSHPNQVCSVSWSRINQYYDPPAIRIACHEIAHAAGLRHTSNDFSCVKRTADGGTALTLSSHDAAHLANEY